MAKRGIGEVGFWVCACVMFVVVHSLEYKYDPNSIPHISLKNLKEIVSAGNRQILLFFYGNFKDCSECERLLPRFHEAVEYLNKLDDGKVESYKVALKFPEYGVNTVPQMLLFVQSTPFMYDGEGREDSWEPNDIIDWVEEAKQTPIQELTDETFEHLTQASTGATTGDWIILFGDKSRPECLKPYLPTMGTIGLRLRMRKNAAFVDTSSNSVTHKRFKNFLRENCVAVLYFHRTELYRVPLQDFSTNSVMKFVLEDFAQVEHEDVPKRITEVHSLVDEAVKMMRTFVDEYAWTHTVHAGLLLIIMTLMLCMVVVLVKKFTKRKIL